MSLVSNPGEYTSTPTFGLHSPSDFDNMPVAPHPESDVRVGSKWKSCASGRWR